VWYSYACSDVGEIIEHDPAVVLVDVHLTAGNGVELVERLKAHGCDFPIVVMTADINAAAEVRQNHPDISHVLEKPFSPRHLNRFLAEIAGRPRH
jgi:FixJ family two-component response regulator